MEHLFERSCLLRLQCVYYSEVKVCELLSSQLSFFRVYFFPNRLYVIVLVVNTMGHKYYKVQQKQLNAFRGLLKQGQRRRITRTRRSVKSQRLFFLASYKIVICMPVRLTTHVLGNCTTCSFQRYLDSDTKKKICARIFGLAILNISFFYYAKSGIQNF